MSKKKKKKQKAGVVKVDCFGLSEGNVSEKVLGEEV
jgi:hypothetical protein